MKLHIWTDGDTEYLWTEVGETQVRVNPDTGSITTVGSAPVNTNLLEAVRSLYANWKHQEVSA